MQIPKIHGTKWRRNVRKVSCESCLLQLFKFTPSQAVIVFNFLSNKCLASFMMKRNPRQINWTVLYRRKHRKGTQEEISKKRTRRTTKFHRAIVGMTQEQITAKRNQKPEVRKAQREQAIKAAKEKNKAAKAAAKKAPQAKPQAKQAKQKVMANPKTKAPRVAGKR